MARPRSWSATRLARPVRFTRGVRAFLRDPVRADVAMATVADEQRHRAERFVGSLDRLVWDIPTSPWRRLFDLTGLARADVATLVDREGLEGALTILRDAGVYLSTEEAQGVAPVRRGSAAFDLDPSELFNPAVTADFIAGTSGTRSSGVAVAASFPALRRMAVNLLLTADLWGVAGAPAAIWRPALPGSGGLIALLSMTVAGQPPERWFSQLDPVAPGIDRSKRLVNRLLPVLTWPTPVAAPRHVPSSNPEPVLQWCRDALARAGRASLNVYPSSAVRLARAALDDGTSLDGLVMRLVGEPVTPAKAATVRAAGAVPVDAYAFTQQGAVATACPHTADEDLHVFDHEVAVITRPRPSPGGATVDALLWTSLAPTARSVWINVENDDHGTVRHDAPPCECLLGRLGMRTRVAGIRGMTKSVTGGVTLPPADVERLVDVVLPSRFGGHPGDWQLSEEDEGGTSRLVVRADPRLGPLDEEAIVGALLEQLRTTETGVLTAAVWSERGFIRLERTAPVSARSGKTLPFEPFSGGDRR